jgi:hypothetical protein
MQSAPWLLLFYVTLATSLACSEKGSEVERGGSNANGGAGAAATGGSANGGSSGSGGSAAMAGTAGSDAAGRAGRGGGGASASGGAAGSGGGTPVSCTITATATVSSAMPTVGTVTWSTDLEDLTEGRVEFGPTSAYGSAAPVKLTEPSYRTLLLGMKPSREYHFRVVLRAGQSECAGPDQTLMTGALDGVPSVNRTPATAAGLAGGYLVGSTSAGGGAAFILDADGDIVWWLSTGNLSRASMSYDSRHLWLLTTNQAGGNPNVRRVSMDGTGLEMHPEFGDAHHDLVVLPDESVGFFQYMDRRRDRLMERAADGTVRAIVDVPTAHGGETDNHSNSIQYFELDDSYTFSDLDQNCYAKVSRQGEVAWVLGGDTSDFTGAGATWNREHGHQLLAPNRILFFNNNNNGANSIAREVTLDLTTMTATNVWQYDGNESSSILGDVQRLWNGNTLVTYSSAGVLHEVNESGTLLQTLSFSGGGTVGYMTKRPSLYGAPPKHSPP